MGRMKIAKQGFFMILWMTFVTGIAYPLLITKGAQLFLNEQAAGSLFILDKQVRGSHLIGQKFEQDKYFWPRPSASDFNPLASGGSHLGPTSKTLQKQIRERQAFLMEKHGLTDPSKIPSGLLFASGSGLDPDLMLSQAVFQLDRVAKARHMDTEEGKKKILNLIYTSKVKKSLNLFGRECVNVLLLNHSLDELQQRRD